MFLKYVIEFHLQECLKILSAEDNLGYYAIKIDFLKLFETYPEVGDKVLGNPIHFLPACDEDLVKAQQKLLKKKEYKSLISNLSYCYLKKNVKARFFGLPVCPELHRTVFPKNTDIGSFLKISGTVVRITQSKMLEYKRMYVCVKCKYEMIVEADFESSYILKAPTKCSNPKPKCKCTIFNQFNLVSREHCKDYQEIKVQEQVNKLTIGTIPGYMPVVLENDLVDSCKPGDDVMICGIVRRRWRPCAQSQRSRVELVFEANYVEVSNAKRSEVIASSPDIKDYFNEFWTKYEHLPLKGRDEILATVCPQIYGLHLVKLAVLLTVITGANHDIEGESKTTTKDENYASHIREQCHLLLVGDPGTGKSQLLKAAADLTPRSVFTTGAGSTLAGLTCVALREDGVWQLEAGALVLSDGGVCCIDEITCLREYDKMAMHEAMEQQTISVAKVGIVCKLNTRCAVIAACNPKGKYKTDQPLSVNVALGTPLLSRFDLIFILMDSNNKSWDALVSKYVLFGDEAMSVKTKWSVEKLQTYVGLIGPRCVQRTRSANAILQSYYMMQRQSECRDPSRTTVRMLDSLIRLSEAHCRLMYRTTILAMDAIVAVALVDLSMQNSTVHDTPDALHSDFQKYPDFEYLCIAKKLLFKLNLYDIWQEELLYYAKLLEVDHKTLECEILNKSNKSFKKFNNSCEEDVCSSSLPITSSYFNELKLKYTVNIKEEVIENEENVVSAIDETVNEVEKEPRATVEPRGFVRRKRKEVLLENDEIQKNDSKKIKKACKLFNGSSHKNNFNGNNDNDFNVDDMLNAVPSVNDIYKNLKIDVKIETSDKENIEVERITVVDKNINFISGNNCTQSEIKSNNRSKVQTAQMLNKSTTNKTYNKLKQFEFKENNDSCNLQKNNKQLSEENSKHSNASTSSSKPSISGSQISMFESSDCDIHLDI